MSKVNRFAQLLVWTLILVLLVPAHIQAGSSTTKIAQWNPHQDIIAVTDGYTIDLYNSTFQLLNQIVVVSDPTRDIRPFGMEWSPDGSKLALTVYGVNFDLTELVVQVWDTTTMQMLAQIPNTLWPAAWSPDSTQIAVIHSPTYGQDVVRLYNAGNGTLLSEFAHTSEIQNITQLVWSSDGSQIAFEERGYVQIWDAANQQYLTTLPIRIDNQVDLAYSPPDNRLAFVDLDNPTDILIWDTTTFQLLRRLQGHTEPIYTFTWGSGGIISVSFDDTTRVWDPDTGQTVSTILTGVTFPPSWNPDGTLFVTTDEAIGVLIRDAATGNIVAVLGGIPTPTNTPTPSSTPPPLAVPTKSSSPPRPTVPPALTCTASTPTAAVSPA